MAGGLDGVPWCYLPTGPGVALMDCVKGKQGDHRECLAEADIAGVSFVLRLRGEGSPWCVGTIQYLHCSGGGMFFYLFYISFILGANQPVAKMLGSHY